MHQFLGFNARWIISTLFLAASASISSSNFCGPADTGKKKVHAREFISELGKVSAHLLCGDDAAMAAARASTSKKSRLRNAEQVLILAKEFEEFLQAEAVSGSIGYLQPEFLDIGTPDERPRVLKSGGQYSRRAAQFGKQERYAEACADLIRALLRPGIDATGRDKLIATLADFLNKAASRAQKQQQDGDLSELFEALELEDAGTDNAEVDMASLKKMYRELSVKHHPDKNPESAARFNVIRDAYEVLSDPVKTVLYDTGGLEMVKKFEKGDQDVDRMSPLEYALEVSLKEIYEGTTRRFDFYRQIVCRSCRLHPHFPRCQRCRQCPGERGQRQIWMNPQQFYMEEYDIPSPEKCQDNDLKTADVHIERGMQSGERISMPFKGNQLPKKIPGDVFITVRVSKHPFFTRRGDDLHVKVEVSLFEALLGFERELEHLDGHIVKFGIPRGYVLQPGKGLHIEGEGMPLKEDPSSFGKLVVSFEVRYPSKIPEDKAPALEAAFRALGQGTFGTRTTGLPARTEL